MSAAFFVEHWIDFGAYHTSIVAKHHSLRNLQFDIDK
jgi:hypothetical protein